MKTLDIVKKFFTVSGERRSTVPAPQKICGPAKIVHRILFVLACFLASPLAWSQLVTVTAVNDLTCGGFRATMNCTAQEFTVVANFQAAPGTPSYCTAGQSFTLGAQLTLSGTNADRYNIGFFTGQIGNDPTANTAGNICSVATFPTTPFPWFAKDVNACGDYTAAGNSVAQINNLKVLCSSATGTDLAVPYALSYSQNSNSCTGPTNVVNGAPSKCNTGIASVTVSSQPLQVAGYVKVIKQTLPDGDAQSFAFTATASAGTPSNPIFNLTDGNTQQVFLPVTATARNLTIIETGATNWETTASITCAADGALSFPAGITINNATRTIVVPLSTSAVAAVCTITNTKKSRITLAKTLNTRVNAADQFTVSGTGGGTLTGTTTATTVGAGTSATTTIFSTPGTALTLTDAVAGGSVSVISDYYSRLTCANALSGTAGFTLNSSLPSNLNTISASITPLPGDDITCTYTNRPKPTITKAFTPTNVASGGNTNLTVTIGNNDASAITLTAALTDNFPPGLTIGTASSAGTCTGVTATAGAGNFTMANGISVASGGCTIIVNVTSSTGGSVTNTIASGALQTSASNNVAAATATLNVFAPPTVAKSFTPSTINSGATSALSLTVTNPTGNPAAPVTTIQLPDAFPTGVSLLNTTFTFIPGACGTATKASGAASAAADNNIRLNVASLAVGASCQLQANVTSTTAGTVTNTTTAVTATGPIALTGGTTSAMLTVVAAPVITKDFVATSIAVGGITTLNITVQNPAGNTVAITGVAFTDAYPAGLTGGAGTISGAGCTGTLTGVAGSLSLSAGVIPVGITCTYSATITGVTGGTKVNNTGAVTSTNAPNGTSASDSVEVVAAPTVTKDFVAASISVGGTTTLNITITNPAANAVAITGAAFTDTYPAGLTGGAGTISGASCTGTLTGVAASLMLSGATIPVGTTCTYSATITGTTAGVKNNTTSTVTSTNAATSATASDSVEVINQATLTKSYGATTPVGVGDSATLTFTITNGATNPEQSNLGFTDNFLAGNTVTAVSAITNAGCGGMPSFTATTVVLAAGTMTAGTTTCTFTATVQGTAAGSYINNDARLNGRTGGINTMATTATLDVRQASVTKAFGAASIDAGGSTTLVFTLANGTGDPLQSGIGFTETLPANLRFNAASQTVSYAGGCTGPMTVTATGAPTLNTFNIAGIGMPATTSSCTVTITGVTNVVGTTGSCAAAAQTNDSTKVTTLARLTNSIGAGPCLGIASLPILTKGFSATDIGVGQTTTLTFTINNSAAGTVDRTALGFTDTLPGAGTLTAVTTTPQCGGTVALSGANSNIISVSGAVVNVGMSCTITATVTGVTAGSYINGPTNTSITGVTANLTNGVTDQTLNVVPVAVTKVYNAASIPVGGSSTLTFTLTNGVGNPAQSNLGFTDTLSTGGGLTITGVTPLTGTNCSTTLPTFTASSNPTVTLTGASMVATASTCTFTVTVQGNTAGTYANTNVGNITLASTSVNTSGINSTLTVYSRATLTKSWSSTTISDGTNTNLIFALTNSATNPAQSGLAFTESLPSSLRFTGAAPLVTYSNGCNGSSIVIQGSPDTIAFNGVSIPNGVSSCTITVTAVTNRSGQLNSSCGNPTAFTNGSNNITGDANIVVGVSNQCLVVTAPDLTLTKTTASSFVVGGSASFTLTARNTLGTGSTAGNMIITDELPAGLSYISAGSGGAGWSCVGVGQTVTCTTLTAIPAGGTASPVTINVTVASNAVPGVTNIATVSGGNEPAVNTGNNSAQVTVTVGNAAVNTFQTDGGQTGVPGTSVLYTHSFNAALAGTVSFSSTDTPSPVIPGWTTQIYRDTNCNAVLDGSEGSSILSGSVVVSPGDQVCLIVKSNIPAAAPYNAQDVITVTATFIPPTGPTVLYTRQDITTVGAAGGSGLTLMKSVRNVTQSGVAGTVNTARPADVIEYVITYTNAASTTVMMVVISDNTPAFTTFAQASCRMPLPTALTSCTVTVQPVVGAGGNVQWTLTGALNSGQTGVVSFRVTVQ